MALGAPQAQFEGYEKYHDLPSKAAVLLYSLAKSQACIDGNKRVALILTLEFLAINGAEFDDASMEDATAVILEAAASDRNERDRVLLDLTLWMTNHIIDRSEE